MAQRARSSRPVYPQLSLSPTETRLVAVDGFYRRLGSFSDGGATLGAMQQWLCLYVVSAEDFLRFSAICWDSFNLFFDIFWGS